MYLTTTLEFEELPLVAFRQIGLYTGLTHNGDFNISVVSPDNVLDYGVLDFIDYGPPRYRQMDQKEQLTLIIQF